MNLNQSTALHLLLMQYRTTQREEKQRTYETIKEEQRRIKKVKIIAQN